METVFRSPEKRTELHRTRSTLQFNFTFTDAESELEEQMDFQTIAHLGFCEVRIHQAIL